MAGYTKQTGGKAAPVDTTEKAIDDILDKMQSCINKCDDCQGKMVKLRNAEVELLGQFEAARNFMNEVLKNDTTGREKLIALFGGDCKRIARIRACLEAANLSDMYKTDNRHPDAVAACETVEAVLNDLGLGFALRKALEEQKESLKTRRVSIPAEPAPMEAVQAEVEEPEMGAFEMEEPVVEEPPPPEPEPPAPEPPAPEPVPEPVVSMDESLIEQILACTSAAELAELPEPDKSDSLGNWMIWMCHRAHLNDPTLEKFDFTNLQMPSAAEEPRISPKLAKAIAANTYITHLLLPNTNLMAKEGGVIAESLTANSSIRVLNIDSNFLGQPEMESLANASGVNQTLEEVRVNNQHGLMMGPGTFEAFANSVKANKMICKLGLTITDAHWRNEIDRAVMRNNDDARKRRVAAKKAAEGTA